MTCLEKRPDCSGPDACKYPNDNGSRCDGVMPALFDKTERPNDLQEWIWHMDLHLTEHDERHAGLALRAAWPAVRAYLCSVENERNTWRELAKKAESAPSASAPSKKIAEALEYAADMIGTATVIPYPFHPNLSMKKWLMLHAEAMHALNQPSYVVSSSEEKNDAA